MEILIGIDFGTTNTVITQFINNKVLVITDGVFKTIPSKIGRINNKLYCGNYIPINCQNIIHSFKITIGEMNTFNLTETKFTHTDLLVVFFKHLHELIYKNLKISDTNCIIKTVITVPSNFNDLQREIIKTAFIAVGFKVIRIINEPSAAALAYGLNHSSNLDEMILVIDTGGGTMDFTILQKTDLFFEVIHSEGLNDLGGNDFTQLIVDDILRNFNLNKNNINNNILWNQAQKVKEKLTYLDTFNTKINLENNYEYSLSRIKFENLSNKLIEKIENTLLQIINNVQNINYIILVGGSSKIPILQSTIKRVTESLSLFNIKQWIHPNLESVVAEGAGLYAGIIENKYTISDDVMLMDVLPLSLGVELADGTYSIIIPKNTPLPVKRNQKYTTDSPCDNIIKVKIYQGERKIANKNFLIGEIIFDKVTTGGVPIIDIAFKINLSSIINVIITDKKSGIEKNILIKDIPEICIDDLNKLYEQSHDLADIDQDELLHIQNIYLIKTHIENALSNLQINDKILEEDKNEIINKINSIEEKLDQMNNLQLIETIKYLQDNFSMIGSLKIDMPDDRMDDVEKMFFNENKIELLNRINILICKNPDWNEFLLPVLEQLSYDTVTIDYINDKLKLLDELENEDKDEDDKDEDDKDYKQEVNNLCMYLKTEIELGNIDLGIDKNKLLIDLINSNFDNLNCQLSETTDIDWKYNLDLLNNKCQEIYQS
jgi:molecular chaperone DnaK